MQPTIPVDGGSLVFIIVGLVGSQLLGPLFKAIVEGFKQDQRAQTDTVEFLKDYLQQTREDQQRYTDKLCEALKALTDHIRADTATIIQRIDRLEANGTLYSGRPSGPQLEPPAREPDNPGGRSYGGGDHSPRASYKWGP